MGHSIPRVHVYVDGFNLYYGALKGSPYRWLDVKAFAQRLLRRDDTIGHLRYFTARVKSRASDVGAAERQAAYLRALETLPSLSIHVGTFLTNDRMMPRADGKGYELVTRTEEKGSDVNLASYLLLDAFDQSYDTALVITNDSDLTEPIRMVQERFSVKVGVAMPLMNWNADGRARRPSVSLRKSASFTREIQRNSRYERILAECQLPDTITLKEGAITKPSAW